MTGHEAAALLQVRLGEPNAPELRRAYLRAVRRHLPERDPTGFQQVRAAYELLKNLDPDFASWGVESGRSPQPPSPFEGPPMPVEAPPPPEVVPAPALPVIIPPPADPALDASATLAAVLELHYDGKVDEGHRLFIAMREALRSQPPPVRPAWQWFAAQLKVAEELDVCTHLPAPVRRAVANGALAHDFSLVRDVARNSGYGSLTGVMWTLQVRKHAPTLRQLMSRPRVSLALLLPLALLGVTVGIFCAVIERTAVDVPVPHTLYDPTGARATRLAAQARQIPVKCGQPGQPDRLFCARLDAFLSVVERQRSCRTLRKEHGVLASAAASVDAAQLAAGLKGLVDQLCPPGQPSQRPAARARAR
jgi:hypothetical protein